MATIVHYCAPNDHNGNPQRCYVLIDPDDVAVAAWDEGYLGDHAVPGWWREAEAIARQCVRTQFTSEIISSHAWPK
jgi:hypothetical protein